MANSYNNIGGCTYKARRQGTGVSPESTGIKLKQLGPDHPDVANSYHNIAFLYKAKKDLPKAKEYWEKAMPSA